MGTMVARKFKAINSFGIMKEIIWVYLKFLQK
jgi:hypothetical protein